MKKSLFILTLLLSLIFLNQSFASLHESAINLLTAKADSGDVNAQMDLGEIYEKGVMLKGKTTKMDYDKAMKYYKLAAMQGDNKAIIKLADKYREGILVDKSLPEAIKYYKLAAKQGDNEAKMRVGLMYRNGEGVEKSLLEAKKYFNDACDNGFDNGCSMYNVTYEEFKSEERKKVTKSK